MDLRGKTALVTGTPVRVGREIAFSLAHAGCDLLIHYNHSGEEAKRTADDIRKLGRRAELVQADLCLPGETCRRLLDAVEDRFGRLDVLVNNAAIYVPGAPGELDEAAWQRMLAINATAPALLSRRFGQRMSAGGGAIVNILDIQARLPWPPFAAYAQTKAALWSTTIGLARELAPAVRVNGVAPGVVLWGEQERDSDRQRRIIELVPLKRTGTPADVAAAVRFLAESDYVTGQVLAVDGGRSIG